LGSINVLSENMVTKIRIDLYALRKMINRGKIKNAYRDLAYFKRFNVLVNQLHGIPKGY